MSIGLRTLVLHADYSPINLFPLYTVPCEDAIRRVLEDTAYCVAHHRKVLTPHHDDLYWPSVIVNKGTYRRSEEVRLKRDTLYYRDHGLCMYCEEPLQPNTITCDHVLPRAHGGHHGWDNVVAACKRCNAAKDSAMPVGRWKPKVKPYKPSLSALIARRKKFPITIDNENWMDFIGPWEGEVYLSKVGRKHNELCAT